MALGIDAQVLAEMAPLLEALGETEQPPIGDVESRRFNGHRTFDYIASTWEPIPGVQADRRTMTTADGATFDPEMHYTTARQTRAPVPYHPAGGRTFGP